MPNEKRMKLGDFQLLMQTLADFSYAGLFAASGSCPAADVLIRKCQENFLKHAEGSGLAFDLGSGAEFTATGEQVCKVLAKHLRWLADFLENQ